MINKNILIPVTELETISRTLKDLGYFHGAYIIDPMPYDYNIFHHEAFKKFSLHIYSEKMFEDHRVRELLLEYLI